MVREGGPVGLAKFRGHLNARSLYLFCTWTSVFERF